MATSLYERVGGSPAVEAAVDVFYRKVLGDKRISRFFDDVDMDRQRSKQKSFLTMVMGGPNTYTGKDMRTAHAPVVAKGMNESHFNAVAEHLQATLTELGVTADAIGEIMAAAASTKNDVLNR